MPSIFQLIKGAERKFAPVFKILERLGNDNTTQGISLIVKKLGCNWEINGEPPNSLGCVEVILSFRNLSIVKKMAQGFFCSNKEWKVILKS